jgi:molybdopterin synthase catalytic subunit
MVVRVQAEAFDPGAELSGFAAGRHDLGAIVSFTGIVRDEAGTLRHMKHRPWNDGR